MSSSSSLNTTPESLGLNFLGSDAAPEFLDRGDGVPSVTLKTKEESCGPRLKNISSSSSSRLPPDLSPACTGGEDLGDTEAVLV